MAGVQVRYIVNDVDAAIAFYCQHLGFHEVMHPAPAFAMLTRGDLRLVLSAPNSVGGGGQSMADGTKPQPGGWNRFAIEVDELAASVEALRKAGAHFRNDIVMALAASRSWLTTLRATPSSCSSRFCLKPASPGVHKPIGWNPAGRQLLTNVSGRPSPRSRKSRYPD